MRIRAADAAERRFLCDLARARPGRSADGNGGGDGGGDVQRVYLLERDQRLAGFYGLSVRGTDCELRFLYLEPAPDSRDAAARLWRHAVRTARRLGFAALVATSTPDTDRFFSDMGAERIGRTADGAAALFRYPLIAIGG